VTQPNVLYYGDNLDVLRRLGRDESVDLVYLDPPFNSKATYNVLFEEHGEGAAAQVRAFEDTWHWNVDARLAYEEVVEQGGPVADTMRAFRTMLPPADMLAYLAMMAPRIVELHRVMKPTATIYLHCDPTASHYLKLLMDAIFGPRNFRNEIVWCYAGGGIPRNDFPRKHDTILRFTKSDEYFYRPIYRPYSPGTVARGRTPIKGKYFEEGLNPEGTPVNDWWADVPKITSPTDPEKLGYPTQKSLALMERILNASSEPGDVVLDPFCGCGTTIDAAQALGRRWIGIDITHLAVGLIKHRLADRYGPDVASGYATVGEPTTVDDARVLAREDPFQFQAWALGLVGARIAGSDKKGGDKGIDGRLYFHQGDGKTRQIVFSVKAGHLVPGFVRDLSGVLAREEAEIGVLLSFEDPTPGMRSEAAEAGFYDSPWGRHPRIQLRTIRELLDGRGVDYPHVTGANVTHRRAPRAQPNAPEALGLFAAEAPAPYDSSDSN
jgi:DNA modification methylase